ncbi:MAG: HD-GYP domain-containing protein [Sulfuricurvum sp.]|uniref:HD-GYP domain-containing protein n=1 Tax=Sulfuricurvum sp. TaxID=2025608 RepID=UPI00260A690F|nr:HD-GYP domain-containing protein [Sulfuricurvum sp.]MDD2369490.1 HD-GYP domain-containing protein [Sulfuricurvum sp.]MDD2950259.1 HD-GYP domain-containing protein [Sulfuricurvum sp.]MDD5119201.1 HD-GYP domain-containing protein [Sulfuricurvum sp.]
MKKHSESEKIESSLRDKIIGLGEKSIRKSYYPQLQKELLNMEMVRNKLADSQASYQSLVENINDVIFSLDTEGTITYISPVIVGLSGYLPNEIIGKSFKEFIMPIDMSIVEVMFKNALSGNIEQHEFRIVCKDGTFRYVNSSTRPILQKGKVSGLTGIVSDITKRKQGEMDLEITLEKLRISLDSSILMAASITEKRDPYTAGHQKRVSQLAVAIATEMNLPEETIKGVKYSAMIHDIGKISIPAEILSKPSALNDIEFSLIKTHPQSGYDILKDINFPWPIAKIVLQHHERLDGSGYPMGLKDDEILLEARIIAVADVVEAISTHRPYRPGLGIDVALGEIQNHRSTYYDAKVVDTCVKLFQEKDYAFSIT